MLPSTANLCMCMCQSDQGTMHGILDLSLDFVSFPSYCKSILSIFSHSTEATTAASIPKHLMKTEMQIQCNHTFLRFKGRVSLRHPSFTYINKPT